jgi:hypothetical protein
MDTWKTVLENLLRQRKTRRVLVLGASAQTWVGGWDDLGLDLERTAEPPADLALLSLPGPSLADIASLRDRCPWIVVLTESADGPAFNEFLALGFERVYTSPDGLINLYSHDIASYKSVPDWLNPKYWAHPERWEP